MRIEFGSRNGLVRGYEQDLTEWIENNLERIGMAQALMQAAGLSFRQSREQFGPAIVWPQPYIPLFTGIDVLVFYGETDGYFEAELRVYPNHLEIFLREEEDSVVVYLKEGDE